ncbi:UNVERIFIED_CONTAM: hypothetical protein HDU68_012141 [Siphonaria sp. JEL0065]|nr:hypothetical protein HDU68_012141 [Siphonaria sp. JEL0065]
MDKLVNVSRVFSAKLTFLPNELLMDIIIQLPTKQALSLRRLSRRFNSVISSKQFAILNLKVHPMPLKTGLEGWMALPESYQEALAETHAMQSQKNFELLTWSSLVEKIPPSICKLTELRFIKLVGNREATQKLKGSIPKGIGNLKNLVSLDLSKNKLFGPIPDELYNLEKLQHLVLRENKITGDISPLIANLTNLTELSLECNELEGDIPHQLGTLANLKTLHLHSNFLSGDIPTSLWRLTNLESLCLTLNRALTGEISPDIRNMQKLKFLNLSMLNVTWPFEFRKEDFPVLEKCFVQRR